MAEKDPALVEAELRARVAHARDPYDAAVWRLLLGEADDGLATLRQDLTELTAGATPNVHLAKLAFLAGDPSAKGLAADAIGDVLARFVAGSREYHATMLALIAEDDAQARNHRSALETFVASHDKLRGGEPSTIASIPAGLVDRDAERLSAGLDALLAWHLRRARARSDVFNSSRGVISLDAIVALILGHRRGLTIAVPSAYRAATVPLLVLYLTEWDGRPLPRAMPIETVTDLVAGPWLRSHGLSIEAPPSPAAAPARSKRTSRVSVASSPADQAVARQALERRMRLGGSPWQLASWALMLGDPLGGRAHLQAAAADAHRRWQASLPQGGGLTRWFSKDQALPNSNIVREHFAYALVIGDEAGIQASTQALQAWLRTQDGKPWPAYGHAEGYLDLICDLLGGGDRANPSRGRVEQVTGPLSSTRVAAIALAARDAALFGEALEGMLTEHSKTLERKSSPPPPVCVPAVNLAAAARRLGVPANVDERFAAWPVPIEGARLPCDLLGRAIWSGLA